MLEVQSQLWILDQHAFHERILFEEYVVAYSNKSIAKQTLIMPFMFHSTPQISALAKDHERLIESLGFEIEILNDKNCAIHTYPSFLNFDKIQTTLEELFQKLIEEKHVEKTQFYHLFYATLACHHAVRAGDPLNPELAQRLLNRARQVNFFAHCPHGRPVIRQFEKKDVESWFLRI